jgi:hypothetical protein
LKKKIIAIPQDRLDKSYVGLTIDEIAEDINFTNNAVNTLNNELDTLIDECNRVQKLLIKKDKLVIWLFCLLISSLVALLITNIG